MKILIVEDEQKIANFLKKSLEAENYTVDHANNGTDGLFLAKTNNYDFIILDNVLPGLRGGDICLELRGRGNNVPILFLSGETKIKDKVEALDVGADDYMIKPYSLKELLSRIKALLRRPKNVQEDKEKIGNLEINRNQFTIKKDGLLIDLTRKEFNLLDLLIKNRGKVVSRGVILESVWDINADPFSNTIESHILSLRRKLDPSRNLIKTIKGRGYIFNM